MEPRTDKIHHDQAPDNDDSGNATENQIFATEEITVEEIAIDGICGVY